MLLFDPLDYVKKMKAAGVPEPQAEIQAEAISGLVNNNLVTKEYLDLRLKALEDRITSVENRFDFKLDKLRFEIRLQFLVIIIVIFMTNSNVLNLLTKVISLAK